MQMCRTCFLKMYLWVFLSPTSYPVLSNLPVFHEVHYWQDGSADACWEDGLRRLQHVVSRSVFCCVLFVCKETQKKQLQKSLTSRASNVRFFFFPTFCAGHGADGPHGAAAERIVPVGVAGGAGRADGQTARCQVHHFFCWRDQHQRQ